MSNTRKIIVVAFFVLIALLIVDNGLYRQPEAESRTYIIVGNAQNPYNSMEIDTDNDGITNFVVETDLWNIADCNGEVTMTLTVYSDGDYQLNVNINMNEIRQKSSSGWVHGYPEIWVGGKPWNKLGPANDTVISFPIQLSKLNYTNICTTIGGYNVEPPDRELPYNFALETWLVTNTTRGRDIGKNEKEIMFWLTYNNIHPAGEKIDEFEIPLIYNGTPKNITFELWKADMGWEYYAFIPKTPMNQGSNISFCWNILIDKAKQYSSNHNWDNLYFMDVELGTEFGSPQYLTAQLSWNIENFEVTTALTTFDMNENGNYS